MRKRNLFSLVALAAFSGAAIVFGQIRTTAPSEAPRTQPAAVTPATVPATNPIAPAAPVPSASQPTAPSVLPPADHSGLAPTSLPSVMNVIEHPQAWQKAVQGEMDKIEDPQLRQQLSEGLGNLTPQIARGLIDHQRDTAYATVAVYRQAGEAGKQAAVALAFEGFGGRLDGTFYGRVLADMPRPPDAADNDAPKGLVLDGPASCYLCFFLSTDGLCAGAIPHETFRAELAAAFLKTGRLPPDVVAETQPAIQEAAVHEWLDQGARQDIVQQQRAQLAADQAQTASATYGPGYDPTQVAAEAYPTYYYGDWGLYGAGWYNPIIIVAHHPLHHDGDCRHWHNWNWQPYQTHPHPQANTPANLASAAPSVTSGNTSSTPVPQGRSVSSSNVRVEPFQQQPVFREPVRQPVQPAAPARSSGAAPPSGTRTGGGTSGATVGSHPTGGSGGGARGGGGAAHR